MYKTTSFGVGIVVVIFSAPGRLFGVTLEVTFVARFEGTLSVESLSLYSI